MFMHVVYDVYDVSSYRAACPSHVHNNCYIEQMSSHVWTTSNNGDPCMCDLTCMVSILEATSYIYRHRAYRVCNPHDAPHYHSHYTSHHVVRSHMQNDILLYLRWCSSLTVSDSSYVIVSIQLVASNSNRCQRLTYVLNCNKFTTTDTSQKVSDKIACTDQWEPRLKHGQSTLHRHKFGWSE